MEPKKRKMIVTYYMPAEEFERLNETDKVDEFKELISGEIKGAITIPYVDFDFIFYVSDFFKEPKIQYDLW